MIQNTIISKVIRYSLNNCNMNNFWRRIKQVRIKKVNSNLEPAKPSEYYQNVMNDDLVLSREQKQVKDQVAEKFKLLREHINDVRL